MIKSNFSQSQYSLHQIALNFQMAEPLAIPSAMGVNKHSFHTPMYSSMAVLSS